MGALWSRALIFACTSNGTRQPVSGSPFSCGRCALLAMPKPQEINKVAVLGLQIEGCGCQLHIISNMFTGTYRRFNTSKFNIEMIVSINIAENRCNMTPEDTCLLRLWFSEVNNSWLSGSQTRERNISRKLFSQACPQKCGVTYSCADFHSYLDHEGADKNGTCLTA